MKYRLNPQSKVAKLTIADVVKELHGPVEDECSPHPNAQIALHPFHV
jgi:hypothetical protein